MNSDSAAFGNNGKPIQEPGTREALEIAREAIGRGELEQGKQALSWVLRREPNNTAAWFWMACCLTDEEAKTDCYRRASR